jgi:uncharacterized protein YndB with AHSA1/START domain
MQDTIERSIAISAPLERVWDLVTEPGWWVPADEPGTADRTPGAVVDRESEKYGRFPVQVVELTPMTYAAFRWSSTYPNADLEPGRTTLIEFTLAAGDDGVTVSVVESGFAALDATDEQKRQGIDGNTDGWRMELDSLRTRAES